MPGMIDEEKRQRINERYLHLVKICKPFIKKDDLRKINKAFEIAVKAEVEEGKPESQLDILHSIEVAIIAVEKIGLVTTSVVCALLHNYFDKTNHSVEEIRGKFDPSVLTIINGFQKISNISTARISYQSENFRKLYISLVDDIRVVLIKLAHRLYDMKVINIYPKDKQKIITSEVSFVYIPIAHRLGLYGIKSEFEELMMKHNQPAIYNEIAEKLQATTSKRNVFIQDFADPIRRALLRQGFDIEIKGRPKSINSIWNKMKSQNLKFEEVYDLFAIRIISNSKLKDEKADCWRIYSIVTDIYPPNPKRLRDWISTPKASGYESLHTTVKGPNNHWVEIQIRTTRMDENAEKGQAAHWMYKGFGSKQETETWIDQVRDILENPKQVDFNEVEPKKISAKSDKIFVFTPNGDLKKFAMNSTVLDFAYDIHTDVGSRCNGAKVNGKNVPIRHVLGNGDKVEIITSKNQKPKLDWLSFVTTAKAKTKIKRAVLEERFKDAEVGNEILRRRFKNWKVAFNEENIDKLIKHYKFKTSIDLYNAVATEKIDLLEAKKILTQPERQKIANGGAGKENGKGKQQAEQQHKDQDTLILDEQLKGVNYHLAKCCNPVWGDPVFGFVTIGKGITIHRLNCPNAARLLTQYEYRIIDVKWKSQEDNGIYQATIKIEGKDRLGMLGEITDVVSNNLKVNMMAITANSNKNKFEGKVKVQVKDIDHLEELLHRISKIEGVLSAKRMA